MPQKKAVRDSLIRRFYTRFNPEAYDEKKGTMPDLVVNDQQPEVLFITCIDSRVSPAMIFKINPGEALNHRHIAALVPPYDPEWEKPGTSFPAVAASIDFAARDKKVQNIIIKGHTKCGGIKAYVEQSAGPLVKSWMENTDKILDHIDTSLPPEELLRQAEKESVKVSYQNILKYPSVMEELEKGTLRVEAWIHDIERGKLLRYDPDTDNFVELQEDGTDLSSTMKTNVHSHCNHE